MGTCRILHFLLLGVLFISCGVSTTKRNSMEEEETISSPFYVVEFFPAPGAVSNLPESVTVSLSQSPHRGLLGALTHYNLNCGAHTLSARSVDSTSGFSSVTVTLPDMGELVSGSSCRFTVSSILTDLSGNRLGGVRTAVYTLVQ